MLSHKFFVAILLVVVLLAPAASHTEPLPGPVEPLFTVNFLPGADFSPTGMNNAGQIVGFAGVGDGTIHAMLYAGGVLSDLGDLGGKDSHAYAISDAGAVTGGILLASGEQHAFLYQHGSTFDLGAGTVGYGINVRGDVVGSKRTPDGLTGFVYSAGRLTQIGNLGTGKDSIAVAINDHGAIAGDASTGPDAATSPRHPFLFEDGELHDLGALGGHDINGVAAINNAGQVAGYSGTVDAFTHAFLYERGVMHDLGGFGDGALDIHDLNEHGTLVGTASTEEEGLVPFMNLGDGLVDLNTLIDPALGWRIFSARANNDLGQIVGYGCQGAACGLVRLDLLSAVPEPGIAWLAVTGLLLLTVAQHRQRHGWRAMDRSADAALAGPRPDPCAHYPSLAAPGRASSFIGSVTMLLDKYFPALALLPALLAPLPSQAAPLYTVNPLVGNFNPSNINNAGEISGYLIGDDGNSHAALYSGGSLIDLAIAGGGGSYANGVNDAGVVTGVAFSVTRAYSAFVYDHGSVRDLGNGTDGFGINARGDVVGQKAVGDGSYTSFLYSDGTLTELGNLGTGNVGLANDINDQREIVGASDIDPERHAPFHPFLYSHGALRDLGILADFENNSASAINNAGRIAGYSEAGDGSLHAFVHEHGHMTDLGGFGGLFLEVGGINEYGAFVGTASTPGDNIGFIHLNGVLVNLNTQVDPALGWQIDGAYGINDAGQIAASACRDFVCSAVRLDLASAVPEPGGALLLVPGLMLLVAARRRQTGRHPLPNPGSAANAAANAAAA